MSPYQTVLPAETEPGLKLSKGAPGNAERLAACTKGLHRASRLQVGASRQLQEHSTCFHTWPPFFQCHYTILPGCCSNLLDVSLSTQSLEVVA